MKTIYALFCLALISSFSPQQMSAETTVLALAGSVREGSYNQLLVKEAAQMAHQLGAKVKIIDLKDYPIAFFDEDLESQQGMPSKARELRQLLINSQVVSIASPEYNASVPAVLKNVIDWASRSEDGKPSRDAFKGKKFVLFSASPGQTGGARGLVHLKTIIEDIGGQVNPNQFCLPSAYQAFDSNGNLKDPELKSRLQQFVTQALK